MASRPYVQVESSPTLVEMIPPKRTMFPAAGSNAIILRLRFGGDTDRVLL